MSLATFPSNASSTPYTVAFASSRATAIGILTPGERWEYDRLPDGGSRCDWLAGRCAAKRAIAARSGVPLEHVQLACRAGAAPRCMVLDGETWAQLPLSVSIAHCDGVAIAAAADSSIRVGVDIERVGEIAPEHLRYFLAASERCTEASLAWVLKEAAWKALALGPGIPFTAVQLSFDREAGSLQGVRVEGAWMAARAVVTRITRRPRLVAAVLEIGQELQ